MRLIDNASEEFHRLWSIRISVWLGVFNGANAVLAAFIPVFNPWFLLVVSVIVNIAVIPLSRLIKQADPK